MICSWGMCDVRSKNTQTGKMIQWFSYSYRTCKHNLCGQQTHIHNSCQFFDIGNFHAHQTSFFFRRKFACEMRAEYVSFFCFAYCILLSLCDKSRTDLFGDFVAKTIFVAQLQTKKKYLFLSTISSNIW